MSHQGIGQNPFHSRFCIANHFQGRHYANAALRKLALQEMAFGTNRETSGCERKKMSEKGVRFILSLVYARGDKINARKSIMRDSQGVVATSCRNLSPNHFKFILILLLQWQRWSLAFELHRTDGEEHANKMPHSAA